jgi:di/tripeptidase
MSLGQLSLSTDEIRALEARLVRYVQVDTVSDENATTVPSTAVQLILQQQLAAELTALGATAVQVTDKGFGNRSQGEYKETSNAIQK